jgi:predicted nuclease of predicted toxin-antitoxin system
LRDFRVIFPDARKGKRNGILDTPIIELCHENRWLLLTQDREMLKTHVEEIKKHPHVTILAAAHGCSTPQEYEQQLAAVIKLKATILRMYRKIKRPWFATFSRDGNITSCTSVTAGHTTRRTRSK